MKRLSMGLTGAALLAALAACGQPSGSANQEAADNVQALPDEAPLNDAAAPSEPEAAEPGRRPPDAETSIPPVPPKSPGTSPKPPPVNDDPHAGHDMGNMANNQ